MDLSNSKLNAFHRRILNGVTLRSTGTHGRGVPMRVQIIALTAKCLAELRPSVPLYCSATMQKNNWINQGQGYGLCPKVSSSFTAVFKRRNLDYKESKFKKF